jgi:membrane protein implicated in regulation of membrane protease activity
VYLLADFGVWWGLSLPLTLVILALVLFLIDIFFQSDIATHAAYVLIALAIAYWAPVHILFRIIIGVVAWAILVWVHYSLWRHIVTHFVNHVIAPTRYRSGAQALIGEAGTIKEINGQKMVSAQGDLWPFECEIDLPNGAPVRIVGAKSGVLRVDIAKEDS